MGLFYQENFVNCLTHSYLCATIQRKLCVRVYENICGKTESVTGRKKIEQRRTVKHFRPDKNK
jgi:hypothetical protein